MREPSPGVIAAAEVTVYVITVVVCAMVTYIVTGSSTAALILASIWWLFLTAVSVYRQHVIHHNRRMKPKTPDEMRDTYPSPD